MRIALATTWGSSCGIATYSEEYVAALLKLKHEVVVLAPAEPGSCMRETISVPVVQCWDRRMVMSRLDQVVNTAPGFDIIHFQHEHGLWHGDTTFIDLLRQTSRTSKAKIVVTLHTMFPYGQWVRSGFYDGLKAVADGIIVHTPECRANIALASGTRAELATIVHGTRLEALGDRKTGLKLLAIPELYWDKAVIGLVFGFQGPGKNTSCTIRAFAESIVRRYHDNGVLVVCGVEAGGGGYFAELELIVAESGYGKRIFLRPMFTAVKDVPHVFAAADFGVLNTMSHSMSASGAAHVYARYGLPIAVAMRPIYAEAMRAGAVPFWLSEDAASPTLSLVNAIGALARDKGLREDGGKAMRAFAEETCWDHVAARHAEFYQCILAR